MIVQSLGIPGPAGDDGRAPVDVPAGGQAGADHRQHVFRDECRRLRTQPCHRVGDRRIGEALEEGCLVGLQVHPRDSREHRGDLVVHVVAQEPGPQRLLAGLVHEVVAGERGEVGQSLVTAVQQMQLHGLVGGDVRHELHAGVLPGRPAGREAVLDHPLSERLAHDRPCIGDAEPVPQRRDVLGSGERRDPVHHAVGEGHFLLHPCTETGIPQGGERGEGPSSNVAVALQVVAGEDREGGQSARPAAGQRLDDQSEGRAEDGVRSQVGSDVLRAVCEDTGHRVGVVSPLGDGQGHDPGIGVCHLLHDGLGVVGCQEVLDDRADHSRLQEAVGVLHDERVQAVLRRQGVPHASVRWKDAHAADAPVQGQAGIQQPIRVHRLVRPVETAHADVHHAGADLATVVGGDRHGPCDRPQGCFLQGADRQGRMQGGAAHVSTLTSG